MQNYALFDDNGLPIGFYNNEVHDTIPNGAISITSEQWREFLDNPGARRWNGREVERHVAPVSEVEARLAQFPNLEPDQFWFVVRASGFEPELLAWVESMKDEPSPANWAAASAKLEFARFFERDHPFVEEARQAIGMTEGELDALWAFGAS